MPRISIVEHLKGMGFNSPQERRKWILEHRDEIVGYYKLHGIDKTRKHYHVGFISLKKLIAVSTGVPQEERKRRKKEAKFTFEDIIASVPNTTVLGQLLVDGIMASMAGLQNKLHNAQDTIAKLENENKTLKVTVKSVTEDRVNIMKAYNEKVLKKKVFTIDQVKHILIPKDKGT